MSFLHWDWLIQGASSTKFWLIVAVPVGAIVATPCRRTQPLEMDMNRNIRSGALVSLAVCAAVGVAAAQTPQSSDTSTSAPKSITVTGCVQQAGKSATGT